MADNTNNPVQNQTIYSDKPIKPEKTQIVINDLQVRAAIRTQLDIQRFRNGQRFAESRYNPDRTVIYDVYSDIINDGHLSGLIAKRIDSVLNKPMLYVDDGGKRVEAMDTLINSAAFRRVMKIVMETIMWGISGIEFLPGSEMQPRLIPRKHIKPKTQKITFEQSGQNEGIDYTTLANVWVIGDPEDLGLLLKCCPYVIYKRNGFADWANYIEIFGQPMRVARYDAHDAQVKTELKDALDNSGNGLALMIPNQVNFEIMDGKQSNGDGQLQERLKDSLNQELSVIVLSNTETTTNGKTGSQAKSKTHQEEQLQITKSDMVYVTNMLNDPQFIQICQTYGLPIVQGGRFTFDKEVDVNFQERRIGIDMQIAEKVPVGDDYWYETYGIPKPANYNELKKKQQDAAQKQQQPPADDPGQDDDTDGLEDLSDKLIDKLRNKLGGDFFA